MTSPESIEEARRKSTIVTHMKDSHTRLREEFYEKNLIKTGDIADFWLSHFSTILESIRKEIEGLPIKENYDGNSLESACEVYCMQAENWTEIIRFENGQDSFKNKVFSV